MIQFIMNKDLYFKLYILDTVASAISSSVDTTKNVASATVEKGTSVIGAAKGKQSAINQKLYLPINQYPQTLNYYLKCSVLQFKQQQYYKNDASTAFDKGTSVTRAAKANNLKLIQKYNEQYIK